MAVDLQAMAPIPGVIQIQGDITKVCIKASQYSLFVCIKKKKNYHFLLVIINF